MKRHPMTRAIAASLAFLLFFQAAFADATEALWSGRRQAVAQKVAALPVLPPASTLAPHALNAGGSDQRSNPVFTVNEKSAAAILAALPATSGRIVSSVPSHPRASVVLIEDIHRNEEAQRNIARAVGALAGKNLTGVIGLEGASTHLDLERFRAFPYPAATATAADYFLSAGEISGPVYAFLLATQPLQPMIGLENKNLYDHNVAVVRTADPLRAAVQEKLNGEILSNEASKRRAFSPELLRIDAVVTGYRQGKTPLGDYLKVLSAGEQALPASVVNFLKALDLEHSLSFPRVEEERRNLLNALASRLSPRALEELAATSIAYRMGKVGHAEFYGRLERLCESNGVPLSQYPAMRDYVRYVLLIDTIDATRLLRDASALETAALAARTKTSGQRTLLAEARSLDLSFKLTNFALTTPEWAAYKQMNLTRPDLAPFEAFYRDAEERDAVMVGNFLSEMEKQNAKTGVFVAGGFHSTGIREKLLANNIACIQFTPRITKVDTAEASKYLSVFTREKTDIDRLFQGERLFLAQAPMDAKLAYELPEAQAATRIHATGDDTGMRKWLGEVRPEGEIQDLTRTGDEVVVSSDESFNGRKTRIRTAFSFSRLGKMIGVVSRIVRRTPREFSRVVRESLSSVVARMATISADETPSSPAAAFLSAINLTSRASLSEAQRRTANAEETPGGRLFIRRAALNELPGDAARAFRSQFAPAVRESFGPVDAVEFVYDGAGRIIAIVPLPNEKMIAAVRSGGTVAEALLLTPLLLIDSHFTPRQPGTASAEELQREWVDHEQEATRLSQGLDAHLRLSPAYRYYQSPMPTERERDSLDLLPTERNPTDAFAFVRIYTDSLGNRHTEISSLEAAAYNSSLSGRRESRTKFDKLTEPAGQGEYKFIIPILPTVYNPGRHGISAADFGYHEALLKVGNAYAVDIGRPLTTKQNRLYLNGCGSGIDSITGYIGWMLGTGQTPFSPESVAPKLEIWDKNPFARANALLVGRQRGIPLKATPPDANAFHDFYFQNRSSYFPAAKWDARTRDTAFEDLHDNITAESLLEDARFYRMKFRGGLTLGVIWDAEYWEGEGDLAEAKANDRFWMPEDPTIDPRTNRRRPSIAVVQTTYETGGKVVAHWDQREEVARLPRYLKGRVLHKQEMLTKEAVYVTWSFRSNEPRPTLLIRMIEKISAVLRLPARITTFIVEFLYTIGVGGTFNAPDPQRFITEVLIEKRIQGNMTPSFIKLLSLALSGRARIRSVDLGTGKGSFMAEMAEKLQAAVPAAAIDQSGTDTGILNADKTTPFPDNAAFIAEKGAGSMDVVTINAAFPNQHEMMLTDADTLLKPDGLLMVTTGLAAFRKTVIPWLLSHGYTVALVADMSNHPTYSIYEGDADIGTLFASKTRLPLFDTLQNSGGYGVASMAPTTSATGTTVRYENRLSIEDPDVVAGWNQDVREGLRVNQFAHRLGELTKRYGVLFRFPKQDLGELLSYGIVSPVTEDPENTDVVHTPSPAELYRLGIASQNVPLGDSGEEVVRYNFVLIYGLMRSGITAAQLESSERNITNAEDFFLHGSNQIALLLTPNNQDLDRHDGLFQSFDILLNLLDVNAPEAQRNLLMKEIAHLLLEIGSMTRISHEAVGRLRHASLAPTIVLLPEYQGRMPVKFLASPQSFIEASETVPTVTPFPILDLIGRVGISFKANPIIPGSDTGKIRRWQLDDGRVIYAKRVDFLRARYPAEEIDNAIRLEKNLQARNPQFHAQRFIGIVQEHGTFYLLSEGVDGQPLTVPGVAPAADIAALETALRQEAITDPDSQVRLRDILRDRNGGYHVIDLESLPYRETLTPIEWTVPSRTFLQTLASAISEGIFFDHFRKGFLDRHPVVTWHMRNIGVPMIWAFAIVSLIGAAVGLYVILPTDLNTLWTALLLGFTALFGFWAGGIAGHLGYNTLAGIFGWEALSILHRDEKILALTVRAPGESWNDVEILQRGKTLVVRGAGSRAAIYREQADGNWSEITTVDSAKNVVLSEDGDTVVIRQPSGRGVVRVVRFTGDAFVRLSIGSPEGVSYVSDNGETIVELILGVGGWGLPGWVRRLTGNDFNILRKENPDDLLQTKNTVFHFPIGALHNLTSVNGKRFLAGNFVGDKSLFEILPDLTTREIPLVDEVRSVLSRDGRLVVVEHEGRSFAISRVAEDGLHQIYHQGRSPADTVGDSLAAQALTPTFTSLPVEEGLLLLTYPNGGGAQNLIRAYEDDVFFLGEAPFDAPNAKRAHSSLDGRTLAVNFADNVVRVYRFTATEFRRIGEEIPVKPSSFLHVEALSGDGLTFAAVRPDKRGVVYRLERNGMRLIGITPESSPKFESVGFSSDGGEVQFHPERDYSKELRPEDGAPVRFGLATGELLPESENNVLPVPYHNLLWRTMVMAAKSDRNLAYPNIGAVPVTRSDLRPTSDAPGRMEIDGPAIYARLTADGSPVADELKRIRADMEPVSGTLMTPETMIEVIRRGENPASLYAEVFLASWLEGRNFDHFFWNGFLAKHRQVTWHMRHVGMPMIWGFAILSLIGAALSLYMILPPDLNALWTTLLLGFTALVGFWAGGILGHVSYNMLARWRGWARLTTTDPAIGTFVRLHADRLDELKPAHSQVLRSRFIDGKTLQKVAEDRGAFRQAIASIEKSALSHLRTLVASGALSDRALVMANRNRLDELGADRAAVLRARFIDGRTLREVAADRGVSVGAIVSVENTALRRLRDLVGGEAPDDKGLVTANQGRLDELKPDHAAVLRSLFVEGKTELEVAAERGVNPTSISRMKRTALRRLRELVASGAPSDRALVASHQNRLDELDPDHAAVLRARFLGGKTRRDVATDRGVTEEAIRNMEGRALRRLRALVSATPSGDRAEPTGENGQGDAETLTLPDTRAEAARRGYDPNGAFTEIAIASWREGRFFGHFMPSFLASHGQVTSAMRFGLGMIWGFAVGATITTIAIGYVGIGVDITNFWSAFLLGVTAFGSFWAGGIAGHASYNALARVMGWNRLTLLADEAAPFSAYLPFKLADGRAGVVIAGNPSESDAEAMIRRYVSEVSPSERPEETIFILEGVDKAADESVAGRARSMASSRNIPVIDVVRGVTHPDVIARAIRSTPMHPSQARLYYLGGLLWSALPAGVPMEDLVDSALQISPLGRTSSRNELFAAARFFLLLAGSYVENALQDWEELALSSQRTETIQAAGRVPRDYPNARHYLVVASLASAGYLLPSLMNTPDLSAAITRGLKDLVPDKKAALEQFLTIAAFFKPAPEVFGRLQRVRLSHPDGRRAWIMGENHHDPRSPTFTRQTVRDNLRTGDRADWIFLLEGNDNHNLSLMQAGGIIQKVGDLLDIPVINPVKNFDDWDVITDLARRLEALNKGYDLNSLLGILSLARVQAQRSDDIGMAVRAAWEHTGLDRVWGAHVTLEQLLTATFDLRRLTEPQFLDLLLEIERLRRQVTDEKTEAAFEADWDAVGAKKFSLALTGNGHVPSLQNVYVRHGFVVEGTDVLSGPTSILAKPDSRNWAAARGFDPDGAFTEIAIASWREGRFFRHFMPGFLASHGQVTSAMRFGLGMIWIFAIGAAISATLLGTFAIGLDVTQFWSALLLGFTAFGSFWAGGIVGHALYNLLARGMGWRRLTIDRRPGTKSRSNKESIGLNVADLKVIRSEFDLGRVVNMKGQFASLKPAEQARVIRELSAIQWAGFRNVMPSTEWMAVFGGVEDVLVLFDAQDRCRGYLIQERRSVDVSHLEEIATDRQRSGQGTLLMDAYIENLPSEVKRVQLTASDASARFYRRYFRGNGISFQESGPFNFLVDVTGREDEAVDAAGNQSASLSLSSTRAWAAARGYDPNGAFTEIAIASWREGRFFGHFMPGFLASHGQVTSAMRFGLGMIWIFAIGAAIATIAVGYFGIGVDLTNFWSAFLLGVTAFGSFWAGGIVGHAAYNAIARLMKWAPLSRDGEQVRDFVKQNETRLDELNPDHAGILRARFIQGRSQTQLAADRGITSRAMGRLETTALRRFRALVAGGAPSDLALVRDNQNRLVELGPDHAGVLRARFIEGRSRLQVAADRKVNPPAIGRKETTALRRFRALVAGGAPSDLALVRDNQNRLDELGPDRAAVLRARFIEGRSQLQMAADRGVNPPAISSMVRTALRRLRALVAVDAPSDLAFVRDNQNRLDELGPNHASVLRARFIEGRSQTQIAADRGVNPASIGSMEKTALGRFRALVAGGAPSDLAFVRDNQNRLDELEPDHAAALRTRFIEGKSQSQIASGLGRSLNALVFRQRTALRRLRELVASGAPSDIALVRDNQNRLDELGPDHADVLRARFIEGRSQLQMAADRGVNPPAISSKVRTALRRFRALVADGALSDLALVKNNQNRLEELGPDRAAVLRARFIEGQSQLQVAADRKVSRQAIDSMESTALRRLRALVATLPPSDQGRTQEESDQGGNLSLALPDTRAEAARRGYDPNGAYTELALAPWLEGRAFGHFMPGFLAEHGQVTNAMRFGLGMIWGFAIGATVTTIAIGYFGVGVDLTNFWSAFLLGVTAFGSFWAGGIAGHAAYNAIARFMKWAPLAKSGDKREPGRREEKMRLPAIAISDADLSHYLRPEELARLKAEGRTLKIRLLHPALDRPLLAQWKADVEADAAWRDLHKFGEEFPWFREFDSFNVGLVSSVNGVERLEGYMGGAIVPMRPGPKQPKANLLRISQMELYYRNIGSDRALTGVNDILWDFLLKFAHEKDRIPLGIEFAADTAGSQRFAARRQVPVHGIGNGRWILNPGVTAQYESLNLKDRFNEEDTVISSKGSEPMTRAGHEARDLRLGFKKTIQSIRLKTDVPIKSFVPADQNGEMDIRAFVSHFGGYVETKYGYLRIDPLDGLLIIVDDRFQGDHAGRGRYAVYARNERTARHEMAELRAWKNFAIAEGIANPVDTVTGLLGEKLRAWINTPGNRDRAFQLHDEFHRLGIAAEHDFVADTRQTIAASFSHLFDFYSLIYGRRIEESRPALDTDVAQMANNRVSLPELRLGIIQFVERQWEIFRTFQPVSDPLHDDLSAATKRFFESRGFPFHKSPVGTSASTDIGGRAIFLDLFDAVVVEPKDLQNPAVVTHEMVHGQGGFGGGAIEEAVVQYLTMRILLEREGKMSPTGVEVAESHKEFHISRNDFATLITYHPGVVAVAELVDRIGLNALLESFVNGNHALIEAALPDSSVWREMIYDDKAPEKAMPVLRGQMGNMLNARRPAAPIDGNMDTVLTLGTVRSASEALGFSEFTTVVVIAPIIEGLSGLHFFPLFPLLHGKRYSHFQWVGMALIFGFAIGAMHLFGTGLNTDDISLIAGWLGGYVGHKVFNFLSWYFGWNPLSLVNRANAAQSVPILAPGETGADVTIIHRGRTMVVTGRAGQSTVYRLADDGTWREIAAVPQMNSPQVSEDGNVVALANAGGFGEVQTLVFDGESIHRWTLGSAKNMIALSDNGRTALEFFPDQSTGLRAHLRRIEGNALGAVEGDFEFSGFEFSHMTSADGLRFVADGPDGLNALFEIQPDFEVHMMPLGLTVHSFVSPDGTIVSIERDDGSVALINADEALSQTGAGLDQPNENASIVELDPFPEDSGRPRLSFEGLNLIDIPVDEGAMILTQSPEPGPMQLIRAIGDASQTIVTPFTEDEFAHIAASSDGKTLAVQMKNQTVRIYRLQRGALVPVGQPLPAIVETFGVTCDLSADGMTLAVVTPENAGVVYRIDRDGPREIGRTPGNTPPISSARMSSSGGEAIFEPQDGNTSIRFGLATGRLERGDEPGALPLPQNDVLWPMMMLAAKTRRNLDHQDIAPIPLNRIDLRPTVGGVTDAENNGVALYDHLTAANSPVADETRRLRAQFEPEAPTLTLSNTYLAAFEAGHVSTPDPDRMSNAERRWVQTWFAPNYEFLSAYRAGFWADHGYGALRSIGTALLWIGALAFPLLSLLAPNEVMQAGLLIYGYAAIAVTVALANLAPSGKQLPWYAKLGLLPAYAPQIVVHTLWNGLIVPLVSRSAEARRVKALPAFDFLAAVGLGDWTVLRHGLGGLERVRTPQGSVYARTVALKDLPEPAGRVLRAQFSDANRERFGDIENVRFIHDDRGRMIAIVPIPNYAMGAMRRALRSLTEVETLLNDRKTALKEQEARELFERIEAPDEAWPAFWKAVHQLNRKLGAGVLVRPPAFLAALQDLPYVRALRKERSLLHLEPLLLTDAYFVPPQPGTVPLAEARARWLAHEREAMRLSLMIDGAIDRLPLGSLIERPIIQPDPGRISLIGFDEGPVRARSGFAVIRVDQDPTLPGVKISVVTPAERGRRAVLFEQAIAAPEPGEIKKIIPVLPTVYNPGTRINAEADEAYHNSLLGVGQVYEQDMGAPLTADRKRLTVIGAGSGADSVTLYIGWMRATGARPFDSNAPAPTLRVWDTNPFALANTLRVGRELGINMQAAPPDEAVDDIVIQNRPALKLDQIRDPRNREAALEAHHDGISAASFLEDVRYYRRKLAGGRTLLVLWDAEYEEGGTATQPAVKVVETTLRKGGAFLARGNNRDQIDAAPDLLRVRPLNSRPALTGQDSFATWAVRSLEPRDETPTPKTAPVVDGRGPAGNPAADTGTPERRLARALVDFATAFAANKATGASLDALTGPVVEFNAAEERLNGGFSTTGNLDFSAIDEETLRAEIATLMKSPDAPAAVRDPNTARTVARLFFMISRGQTSPAKQLPRGNLLFPNAKALSAAMTRLPDDPKATLYVLRTQDDAEEIDALLKNGRKIVLLAHEGGFRKEGHLDFSAVDEAVGKLGKTSARNITMVLEGADLETLMAQISSLPKGSALLDMKYVAVEELLNLIVPVTAADLIGMNIMAEALAAKQA